MVVEITMVQFKQLRTTTPEKKKNEGPHLYIATNKYHRFKICTIDLPANAGLITSIRHTFFVPYKIIPYPLPSFFVLRFIFENYILHICATL